MLKELYDKVMAEIRPNTFPFGVKFYRSTEERPAKTMRPAHPMNVCQGTSPEEMTSGKIAPMLHADIESAKSFTDLVPRIPFGQVSTIATVPSNALTFSPDLVVMYGNTSQVMRLNQAYLYKKGGHLNFSTGGEYSLCADILADAYNRQDLTVAIPYFGDRKTALAQDDELTIAFPMLQVKEILEGLEGTKKTAAYPTPFDIGFPQMPDYTLTGWAVNYRKSKKE